MIKEELIEFITDCIFFENDIQEANLLNKLSEFFSQNVCIPKGENRHHYADVWHGAIEGLPIQEKHCNEWCNISIQDGVNPLSEYRIKPSEPVYEWQWMYKFKNGNEFQFTGYETETEVRHFMSQLDKDSIGHYATKIEETKRVRNA